MGEIQGHTGKTMEYKFMYYTINYHEQNYNFLSLSLVEKYGH